MQYCRSMGDWGKWQARKRLRRRPANLLQRKKLRIRLWRSQRLPLPRTLPPRQRLLRRLLHQPRRQAGPRLRQRPLQRKQLHRQRHQPRKRRPWLWPLQQSVLQVPRSPLLPKNQLRHHRLHLLLPQPPCLSLWPARRLPHLSPQQRRRRRNPRSRKLQPPSSHRALAGCGGRWALPCWLSWPIGCLDAARFDHALMALGRNRKGGALRCRPLCLCVAGNQRSEITLSLWRGSRRSPRYWLCIGSSSTVTTLPVPKPLKRVFIAAP